jgi:hypothetical protein
MYLVVPTVMVPAAEGVRRQRELALQVVSVVKVEQSVMQLPEPVFHLQPSDEAAVQVVELG